MPGLTYRFFTFTERGHTPKTLELSEATLAVDAAAAKLCAGLTEEQLSWQPRPRRWSIAQNLAHLRATTEIFLPVVDSALEASRKLTLHSDGPFTLNLLGRVMVWRMDSRPIIKMQAPMPVRPRLLGSPALELEHFLTSQAAIRQRIADADGLDLTALRFPSPVASYFRVNLLEFFSAFNAHSRRHLWQANNVRRALHRIEDSHFRAEARSHAKAVGSETGMRTSTRQ
jgi:DinB superfamily